MIQPWIHKPKTDSLFILLPSFIVVAIVFLFQKQLLLLEAQYSFYTWLFLIVFIDVAHVYATLFKTYFVAAEFQKRKKRYLILPFICFVVGVVLFSFGSNVFWSTLAYIAVFHFIRQQYGFMRLYARAEAKLWINKFIDNLVIYTATLYPMLFWFLSTPRNFNWFINDEFFQVQNDLLLTVFEFLYFAILLFYVLRTLYLGYRDAYFNIPKNAIIVGTALSWYFGIVYFNNDLVFTLLNVVSHGVPYLALIYLNEIQKKDNKQLRQLYHFKHFKGVLLYVLVLLLIAFSEEYLWEILVWNHHFSITTTNLFSYQYLLVPLLTVPQFTHYILDGIIWKNK
jgi:hypothetical protein